MSSLKLRVALPGYDAKTDSDPYHFSLYSDEDNILIKEKQEGTISISSHSYGTIQHNLGYVPLSYVFIEYSSNNWRRIDGSSFDYYDFYVDNNYLVIHNTNSTTKNFSYRIFYDEITAGTASFTESSVVLKVPKSNKSISSTNPNDFIFHSDLNTLKMIKNSTIQGTLLADTFDQTITVAHGLDYIPLVNAFAKSDAYPGFGSRVFGINSEDIYFSGPKAGLWSSGIKFNYAQAGTTNISFNFDNKDYEDHVININYYCLEKI